MGGGYENPSRIFNLSMKLPPFHWTKMLIDESDDDNDE